MQGAHEARREADALLATGTRLWLAADTFAFMAFLFAYLYLRELDPNGLWHPHGQGASTAAGLVVTALVVGTALAAAAWVRRPAASGAGLAALALAVIATAAATWQLVDPGFSPSHAGGWGSVFVGYTGALTVHLLGGAVWLEIALARAWRAARIAGESEPLASSSARVAASASYWYLLASVQLLAFLLLYVGG